LRFIDTNVLLYAVSRLPEEAEKRAIAHGILDSDDCALSVQVLQEFYVQATRTTRVGALTHSEAKDMITVWRRFPVQAQTVEVLDRALSLKERYRLSFWDSAIIAAASILQCRTLLTEDMQHGQVVDGLRVVNPFG
jgi:predicted nucleic acid-binding protein